MDGCVIARISKCAGARLSNCMFECVDVCVLFVYVIACVVDWMFPSWCLSMGECMRVFRGARECAVGASAKAIVKVSRQQFASDFQSQRAK